MSDSIYVTAGAYLLIVSLISVVTCISDKLRAKSRGKRRVPEKTLFLLSALGGSVAMLLTMLTIRHKTKHASFMIGIPLIILAQCALVCAILYYFVL